MKYTFVLLFMIGYGLYGQELHHQMLSSQGKSVELSNGIYVSQTIGQQSAIGNSTKEGYVYGQGFQQSVWGKYISANAQSIIVITYPNPFVETINFEFSKSLPHAVTVNVFDVGGRLVYQKEKKMQGNILSVDMSQLAESNYLVQLTTPDFIYYTQIIKKQ